MPEGAVLGDEADRLSLIVIHRLVLFLPLLVVAYLAAPASAQQSNANDLLLILDASGSMWGRNGGEEKIVIARRVLKDLASRLPDGSEVGLIAYGHRREADCADSETIVSVGPLDRVELASRVEKLNPKGKTPVTQSIEQAIAAVQGRRDPATIVLLSDGIETCSGDPCAAVSAAQKTVAAGKTAESVVDFAQ